MVRVVTEQKRPRQGTQPKPKQPAVSEQQAITLLAWLQARHPKAVKALLKQHGVAIPPKTSARKLNDLFNDALHTKGRKFQRDVERLLADKLPGVSAHDSFMPMDEKTSNTVGAAMKIGSETGSGAAGGGWVGAALGLGSGITQVVANSQQKKMQTEQQRNTMFQSLMAMRANKSGGGNTPSNPTKTILLIGGALVVLGGLAFVIWKATRPPAAQSQPAT